MKLQSRIRRVADVTPTERDAMFALMDRHYENVDRARFDADLAEKDWVIQVVEPERGALCGFSTQMRVRAWTPDGPVAALFSGDTIMAREHWGDSALAGAWGRLVLALIDHAAEPLFWFLISKGYKTYRFLPVFFREYYPAVAWPTPPAVQRRLDALARSRYPRTFDAERGLIPASADSDRLRPGVADLTPERLHDPAVRFFHERNPAASAGDELCCLAPLTRANFTAAALRVIRAAPLDLGDLLSETEEAADVAGVLAQ
jgi:hypothetical protein